MIIGISGQQRTGKDAITALIISELFNDKEINQCDGNCTIYLPNCKKYPNSVALVDQITKCMNKGITHRAYVISEAHRVLNPLLFKFRKADEIYELASIFMDDKLKSYIIYNFHSGNVFEDLLGVEKFLRGATNVFIDIISDKDFVRKTGYVIARFRWTNNGMTYEIPIYVRDSFKLFNTDEVVK